MAGGFNEHAVDLPSVSMNSTELDPTPPHIAHHHTHSERDVDGGRRTSTAHATHGYTRTDTPVPLHTCMFRTALRSPHTRATPPPPHKLHNATLRQCLSFSQPLTSRNAKPLRVEQSTTTDIRTSPPDSCFPPRAESMQAHQQRTTRRSGGSSSQHGGSHLHALLATAHSTIGYNPRRRCVGLLLGRTSASRYYL